MNHNLISFFFLCVCVCVCVWDGRMATRTLVFWLRTAHSCAPAIVFHYVSPLLRCARPFETFTSDQLQEAV